MQKYNNLYLIGSSHIAKQSIKEINSTFINVDPDIIAVELDRNRAFALMTKAKPKLSILQIGRIGLKGYVFALIGSWASNKLGNLVGVKPGSEMKSAIELAKKNKRQVAFIDQDIEITLKRFSKKLSWKERWHFVEDIFKAVFLRKKDPLLNFDLSKVPEKKLIKMMIDQVKIRYPNIYEVLIKERNYFMARKLKKIMAANPEKKILAVVGAGHEEEIIDILKENDIVTYSYSFSVNQ